MKPVIFIDFDGTLCHDRFWRSAAPSKQALIQQFLFAERQELISDWMRGKHTSEDINMLLAEKIHTPYPALWKIFLDDCQTMNVPMATLQKVTALRKKFITVLATDNMDCFTRFTVPALHLRDYFDDIINSADVGMCKSDATGKFFIDATKKYSSKLSRSMLIDNSQESCNTIEGLGGRSCLVTNELPVTYWLEHLSN